ncbi:MAG TPA: carboxymuconolactone decarboxylase family protein [Planctomycetota bacterium]|jgi:alkylhydroperoxidase/carboxymuconolactone decarboxylase family protein YurZ|nr:carboxymuconolactone decarboxylase family protein [Planctomycetota bacterium]
MKTRLPEHFQSFRRRYPRVAVAHESLASACHDAGPLAERVRRLVKLGIAIGAREEGAVHAQVRQALEAGVDAESLRHVALLAIPTVGFPAAMAAASWIEDLLARRAPARAKGDQGRGGRS